MTHPVADTGAGARYSLDRRRCSLPQSALLAATLESGKVCYRGQKVTLDICLSAAQSGM